jgi:hypothetical protein
LLASRRDFHSETQNPTAEKRNKIKQAHHGDPFAAL